MNRYKPIPISRTEVTHIVNLLKACSVLVDNYCNRPSEQDKARQCRQQIKKLIKKLDYDNNNSGRSKSPA
jgi:hypothetical protein